MKRLFIIFLLSPIISFGQFAVYDGLTHKNNKKTLKNSLVDLIRHIEHLEKLKATLEVVNESKQELIKKFNLQEDVRDALRRVVTTKDLQWADLEEFINGSITISSNINQYLGIIPFVDQLHSIHQLKPKSYYQVKDLYQLFTGFDSSEPIMANYTDLTEKSKQTTLSQYALAEATDKKKIHTALIFNKLSDELASKATELQQALKTNQRFKMTEAERLQALKNCREYLTKSLQLKQKSDELITSVIENESPVKKNVIQGYYYQLMREEMSEVGQYRY